jgi:hypothetical protein
MTRNVATTVSERGSALLLADLAEVARTMAETDSLWRPLVRRSQRERWYEPLTRTDDYEAWLIGWPRDSGLELHDHGGASGAVRVLAGGLVEIWWDRSIVPAGDGVADRRLGRLSRRTLRQGSTVVFGPTHVHDVRARGRRPALSIHVYSPRLTSITFYERSAGAIEPSYTAPQPTF